MNLNVYKPIDHIEKFYNSYKASFSVNAATDSWSMQAYTIRYFAIPSQQQDFFNGIIAKFNVYLMILTFATFVSAAIGNISIKAEHCRTKTSAKNHEKQRCCRPDKEASRPIKIIGQST